MKRIMFISLFVLALAFSGYSKSEDNATKLPDNVKVLISTNLGNIEVELYPSHAPVTVKNFLSYVQSGFYDNVIFHRVINGFMIQGGGFDTKMQEKTPNPPIIIESNNGLKNTRGTIAMARTNDPNSATSQFFINHKDNSFLNYKASTNAGWGYAVFGKVYRGMDVVDKIAEVQVGKRAGHSDVPTVDVIIKSIKVVK